MLGLPDRQSQLLYLKLASRAIHLTFRNQKRTQYNGYTLMSFSFMMVSDHGSSYFSYPSCLCLSSRGRVRVMKTAMR